MVVIEGILEKQKEANWKARWCELVRLRHQRRHLALALALSLSALFMLSSLPSITAAVIAQRHTSISLCGATHPCAHQHVFWPRSACDSHEFYFF